MWWTRNVPRWLAAPVAVLACIYVAATLTGNDARRSPGASRTKKPAETVPLFTKTEPAANTPVLILQSDDHGIHGWIAGKIEARDAKVVIEADDEEHEITIGAGGGLGSDDLENTFCWEYTTKKQRRVTASVTLPGHKTPLRARTTLLPPAPSGGPTIFFITDRSAYRPGHTLKFAAYLRTLLPNGEFEPIRNRDVTVDLTSTKKETRACRLKLKADGHGRVTGEYTFSDADALDHYTLTADGFAGDARILLGEYRKSKVGMKLTGEVKDDKLIVTFDARDYLKRPAKGTAASYTATVTRTTEPDKLTLNPEAFAKPEGGPPKQEDFEALPDDERLLTLANGVSAMTFAGFGSRHVASREGTVVVPSDGRSFATLELDLKPEWLKGSHSVMVSGVFTDENGRENRATATFKLDPKPTRGVKVSTSKELFTAGEKIPVKLAPFGFGDFDKMSTTLLVVRLDAHPADPWFTPEPDPEGTYVPDNTRLPALGRGTIKKAEPEGWRTVPVFDPVKRKITSTVPVVDNAAEVALKQPGAYKLLAVTRLADGTTLQSETGLVVQSPDKLPGVVLQLQDRELSARSILWGTVHTRFAGAQLLLTIRDSTGIKLTRALTANEKGVARISYSLPSNLQYGCAVSVQYPESAAVIHADQRDLFVIPTDRTIEVKATAPAEVGPGADVKFGVQIDRQEETDLIVSVFDESLLGVSGDLSRDIRNFYLADTRGQGRAGRELAATRAGAMTLAQLVKKAEELIREPDAMAKEPGLERRLSGLIARWKVGEVAIADVVTLIRLTGLEVYLAHPVYPHFLTLPGESDDPTSWKVPRTATLADLLRWEKAVTPAPEWKVRVSATVIGNVALIGMSTVNERDNAASSPDPWIDHRRNSLREFNSAYGYAFSGGFGQFGQFGFRGFGGFQGGFQGGFGGFGGFRGGFAGGFGGGGFQGGFQGGFSYPAGGQMGMSFAFNRDFGPQGPSGVGAPLPGLGLTDEVVRRDFADSAYWSATLRTDKTGKATATFKVPDSLTNWRVQVTAVSSKMHVGTGSTVFKTIRPIMVWPMLPRTFTEGDTVRVFATVHNLTAAEQSIKVHLKAENGQVLDAPERTVQVSPMGNVPVYWSYRAGTKGFTDLLMSAKCDAGSDASLKKLPVTAAGIVERATASGLVGKGELAFNLPDDFDASRASATVTIAPTIAADLADTLPYLVEYPYGCVEQTMSRFLPAIRVSQILRRSGITNKELDAKLPKVVEAGQKRLIELQQPDGGWGWQGSGATHEMMTPYALYGLIASEEAGYPCPNPNTISRGLDRLRAYLNQMNGVWNPVLNGNVRGSEHRDVNDSLFCLWVLAMKADGKELEAWWPRIDNTLGSSLMSDYGHALALELAAKKGKKELAGKLADELRKRAKKSGDHVYWTTARFSRWADNTTEITAAVLKALVAHDPNDPLIPGILAFFHGTKRGDRWDSTKDTACVLYALCDYLAAASLPRKRGESVATGLVKVTVNGIDDGNAQLDSPASRTIQLSSKSLKAGKNVVTVTGPDKSGGALARVVVSFTRGRSADIPARDHGVRVERTISVRGADRQWKELKCGATVPAGSYVKVRATATPGPGTTVQYTLLESPKPAGGETVPADDPRFRAQADSGRIAHVQPGLPVSPDPSGCVLREDREAMTCFHYERADGAFTAEYVLLTEFAGEFRIAPARVELMYKPTVGGNSESFVLHVEAKK